MPQTSDADTSPRPIESAPPTPLDRASEAWGIEREFWDIWGKHHITPPATEQRVLKSLGVDAYDERRLENALADRQWREWSRPLAPTIVVSNGPSLDIPVQIPADVGNHIASLEIRFENGISARFDIPLGPAATTAEITLRNRRFIRKSLRWPGDVCLGYHSITLRIGQRISCDASLIVCPGRAYIPEWLENGRTAGIGVSLYSLRSARNWGCGDFTDLLRFIDWAARELNVGFIGLNPLHEIPNRQPFNTSPYLPNCSFYRNSIYLDIEQIEEFGKSRWAQRLLDCERRRNEIEALRSTRFVEYERVHRLKTRFLKVLFRQFLEEFPHDTPRAREFRAYIEREGDRLHRFAVHAALDEAMHKRNRNAWNWQAWPEQYRNPDSAATRDFAATHWRSVLFHKYVQWQVDMQLNAVQKCAQKRGLRIGLYHDLALATDRFGCDLWSNRDFYICGCRVGSPPDNFAPNGQDWAFPPPNSERHYLDSYRLFSESIRKNCQHGGALRVDHVMRFFRLFWIPDGMEAVNGTYVQDRFEDLLRIVALESVRNKVIVVGEDLGTVPDIVRETLARFRILSYRLFYFEQDKDRRFRRLDEYSRQALVSVSTHDLPTLAGFWANRDIEARRHAGVLSDDGAYRSSLEERAREKQKILDLLFEQRLLPDWFPRNAHDVPELTGELHNGVVGFLASTPSMMMLLNQEDLFKETEQQNLPGTTAEYPNWRRKMRFTVEELSSNEFSRNCAGMFRAWIERTGRGNRGKAPVYMK